MDTSDTHTFARAPGRRLGFPLLLAVFAALAILPSMASAACFSNPSSCGYPDASNTGVPAGTTLTPSGSVTLSTPGQVLNSVDLTGSVTVTAPNVTIENSKLHTTSGGSGTRVITLNQGATGFTLKDSEVYGNGSTTNAPQSGVWNHYDNSGAQVLRSYLHGFPDSWEGRVDLFKDSYGVVDAAYSGSHDEIIYVCSTTVKVEHSTLINQHGQTATVFGDTICGGGNTFTVTDSLLAGGGYIVYPQANTTGSGGSTNVSGNRIARCTTQEVVNSSGDHLCQGGTDEFGLFPNGGKYGYCSGSSSGCAGFSNNVWDNNGACIEGSCSTSPPPADTPATAVWTAPSNAKVGTAVSLNGSSSTGDAPITCQWSIENSAGAVQDTRTGCQATYTFQTAGTQFVKLTVTDVDGDTNSSRKSFAVAEATTPPPADTPATAVWTAPSNAKVGTAVSLNGSSSTGDAPITCQWSIENSAGAVQDTRTGCQATYTFQTAGTQFVKLTVTDVDGDTNSSRKSFAVAEATTPPPADTPADAVWTAPSNATVGTPVSLNGTASTGTGPITCKWSFEDATSTTVWETHEGCAITFVFEQADEKYVKLTVSDADGDTDSNRQSFPVAATTTPPPPRPTHRRRRSGPPRAMPRSAPRSASTAAPRPGTRRSPASGRSKTPPAPFRTRGPVAESATPSRQPAPSS